MSAASPPDLGLRRALAARSLPLAVGLVAVVTVSAPTALYVTRVHDLRAQAREVSGRLARTLSLEAAHRPRLWQYDSIKLLEHLRALQQQPDLVRLEITDARNQALALDPAAARPETGLAWEYAPIDAGGAVTGSVWVAASLARARREAGLLALPFLAVGLVLAGFMFWIPLRSLALAEQRIAALIDDLERSRDKRLRDLSLRALALQEAERRAIARELHDALGQALTAVRIHLQLLDTHGSDETSLRARGALALTDAAIEEVRRAVRLLGPAILDDVGLARALERHCEDVAAQTGITVRCRIDAPTAPWDAAIESACYRIVQEALTNVVRHAGARTVEVVLCARGEGIELDVHDDGSGFNVDAIGDGIAGMRERAELLGGGLSIDSAPGRGTWLRARFPIAVTTFHDHARPNHA